ncbi:MAG: cytochrome c [Burkholderiaceae bacterium]
MRAALIAAAGLWAALAAAAPAAPATERQAVLPATERQAALVRMVRHDCGSCHGMRLTGGLGPALTREALADKPVGSLAATIQHGRPGTPMPGWKTMLSDEDAQWIAAQLVAGFPADKAGGVP